MIRITVTENHKTKTITASAGDILLHVLRDNGIMVQSPCGGRGLCDKCLVQVLPEGRWIKSCQTKCETDLQIEVKPTTGSGLANWVKKDPRKKAIGYGVAVDLGTTTLAIYLVDLEKGAVLDTRTCLNRQGAYGADVISRIKAAGEGHLDKLADLVCDDINQAITFFKERYSIKHISKIYVAGNPTMLHIIARVSPVSMGFSPYTPGFTEKRQYPGNSLHLDASEITLMPSISAFVGGDVTMGMIASRVMDEKAALLIDLGTNGEMVLKTKQKTFATSTATGPAFEGATITMGMGGVEGAINRVEWTKGQLSILTVSGEPKGISGSGLVDLVAILVDAGLIDETGRFDASLNHPLANRFRGDRFYLTDTVFVNQADVREFQLAKSAIASGVLSLALAAQMTIEAIDKVFLAGGFGFYLDLDHLFSVGILPLALKGKIQSLGNASGQGLIDCLLDDDNLELASQIASDVQVIDLASRADFVNLFVENMLFTPGGNQG